MKNLILILSILLAASNSIADLKLSKKIFRDVPFSSQYSEDGALIRSVDFRSVNDLVPQIEEKYADLLKGQKLKDRNEAHITIITPPDAKTGFFPGNISIDQVLPTDEMISIYKPTLQQVDFKVVCLGKQQNDKGNIVFYLIVESEDIDEIRAEIEKLVTKSGRTDIPFKAKGKYYPHITIGFVGGDVHGVRKDICEKDVNITLVD